jgi:hydroxyacylglutathione hydrolase
VDQWVSDGVAFLGRFRPCSVGCWVLHHGGEAAILEMPPSRARRRPPWSAARAFLRRHDLRPKFMLTSHVHWDHLGGYPGFRRTFPRVPFLAHESFLRHVRFPPGDHVMTGSETTLDLGGEPLIVLHAPKHSPTDLLVIFRGTVATGDWSLGRAPDCNGLVPKPTKVAAMTHARDTLHRRGYGVHTAFSAHANETRRGIDFAGLLDDMIGWWARR